MAERDFYKILGVERTADEKEIKKAFRKLAKKYHPDTNQGNASAEQRFKEINEAYDVLGDPKKRSLYDKYGEMAFREGFDPEAYEAYRRQGFGGASGGGFYRNGYQGGFSENGFGNGGFGRSGFSSGGFGGNGSYSQFHFDGDMEDLFSGLFGRDGQFRKGSSKGADLRAEVSITLEEAVTGCDRMIRLAGEDGRSSAIQVHIPAGIDEGQKVRLKGKGGAGTPGGDSGDLFLEVHIQPKKGYERKGQDVYVTADIPFTTAALGGEAVVPTLYGNVKCTIRPGTQSGSKVRLRGKGMPSMKDPSVRGDEYVVIRIQVPQVLSEQQKQKLREFERLSGSGNGHRAA